MRKLLYLLHGKGGSPTGTVAKIEETLKAELAEFEFRRERMPHSDPNVLAQDSLPHLDTLSIPHRALILGVSLGGLVAARYQETKRPDLGVICLSSPTWADGVKLATKPPNRIAVYSSNDDVIQGRTADWHNLAEAHDVPTLTHATDQHLELLRPILVDAIHRLSASSTS